MQRLDRSPFCWVSLWRKAKAPGHQNRKASINDFRAYTALMAPLALLSLPAAFLAVDWATVIERGSTPLAAAANVRGFGFDAILVEQSRAARRPKYGMKTGSSGITRHYPALLFALMPG
jgi:hypothetical protein